jgi:UDP-N-acetylmuramoylalanine--D-glutamate ligase
MRSLEELDRGREVAVIGLGRSGSAATRLLRARAVPVYAADSASGATIDGVAAALRALGASVDTGGFDADRIARAGLVIASPGIPPDAPPLVTARESSVPVWAEAELGLRALEGRVPYVAITGTNGKTTTTALVGHLLVAAGKRARTAGNIGTPLSEIALAAEPPEILAVELSSFQLHDMPTVNPAVGIVTNLAPDHLDRYGSLAEYYGDKLKLFANANPESFWVTNADNAASEDLIRPTRGRRRRFSVVSPADGWLDRAAAALRLGEVRLIDRHRFPLLGDHNVANALAAALAVHALGVSMARIEGGLGTVAALKHRMEPIREVGEVLWINDSKATNVSSTEVAVIAMDRPFVLLLGGRHKGEPYTRLADHLGRGRCRGVIAYGEAKPTIVADLADQVELVTADTFDDVIRTAARMAHAGDAVLLSPACSSYDMFTNYEERGARFRAMVEAL